MGTDVDLQPVTIDDVVRVTDAVFKGIAEKSVASGKDTPFEEVRAGAWSLFERGEIGLVMYETDEQSGTTIEITRTAVERLRLRRTRRHIVERWRAMMAAGNI